jgi:AraC-like DNA-binding protein
LVRRDMMRYREYPPHPALAGHVACFWSATVLPPPAAAPASSPNAAPGRPAFSHRVLPDNCIDILWQDSGLAFAVGMMSRFFDVPADGPVRTVAVRFLPGAAALFLGTPLAPLTDGRADLDLLWPRSDADRLSDALWSSDFDDRARLRLIESALLARLALSSAATRSGIAQAVRAARAGHFALPAASPAAILARHAVAAIESSGGELRVETLADSLGVSRQHLSAQFREQVGLTPKLFARITRFRRATAAARDWRTAAAATAAHASPAARAAICDGDWADLALACGYFDQSHLIRDFHDFAGASPDAWLLTR